MPIPSRHGRFRAGAVAFKYDHPVVVRMHSLLQPGTGSCRALKGTHELFKRHTITLVAVYVCGGKCWIPCRIFPVRSPLFPYSKSAPTDRLRDNDRTGLIVVENGVFVSAGEVS